MESPTNLQALVADAARIKKRVVALSAEVECLNAEIDALTAEIAAQLKPPAPAL